MYLSEDIWRVVCLVGWGFFFCLFVCLIGETDYVAQTPKCETGFHCVTLTVLELSV